uniref:Uncharacterized protein n=1 Tax=Anguilla anguilla TaxID=7936 RepID=A0A0E9VZF0_ANGAN
MCILLACIAEHCNGTSARKNQTTF